MELRKDTIDGVYLERLSKSKVLIVIFSLIFAFLLVRIAYIQIHLGEKYLRLSKENRFSREMLRPERGLIYDRMGRIIAQNRPSYSLYITPAHIPREKDLFTQLAHLKTPESKPFFPRKLLTRSLRTHTLTLPVEEQTPHRLYEYLTAMKDEDGSPLFPRTILDSLFSVTHPTEYSMRKAFSQNSFTRIRERLLTIADSHGSPLFDTTYLDERLAHARRSPRTQTMIAEDISLEYVSILEEHSTLLPGISIEIESRREYPYGKKLFHVLGYLSEINQEELTRFSDYEYHRGDQIGKSGIEAYYDTLLMGEKGWAFVERNSRGTRLGIVEGMPYIAPTPGNNIYLTIDAELQRIIAEQFDDTLQGAVVAMDPRNGEVLAMYSNPSFDANTFSLAEKIVGQEWRQAQHNPRRPLINKAIASNYSPGSTFKLITALAGLEAGVVSPGGYMDKSCDGGMRFGNRYYRCWYRQGHGRLSLEDALKTSCNVYFYQLGLLLGDEQINHFAGPLSLGDRTGIDLPGESRGYLSGSIAHNLRHANRGPGWRWTRGLLLNMAIGQSQDLTPLQMALIPASLSGQDSLYAPHLLKEIRSPENAFITATPPTPISPLPFDSSTIESIKEGMWRTVHVPGGTGWRSRVSGIPVGGKTGTAQNPHGENHAVYVAAAPLDEPAIVVSVLLAHAGGGGVNAAPVAQKVFDYFFTETPQGESIRTDYDDWDGKEWAQ
ncbi:penicillin-binding protein 2 [Chitinivibrio alkaliphilus]|uniref:Penicillin-binding protein 2 n=1 Tax=Chitinivibrio alkaliphilus ACht1 TaxID=1313304 RepID=U7DBN0_9BACT|nr:penicillin-binding protein 2 [Chitinivibrio alkaliphilus]ERP38988.1 penicillin-binding protein 2 [Chitinivibrio alkaliphilus ACht1]